MRKLTFVAIAAVLTGCVSAEQMDKIYGSQRPPNAGIKSAAISYIKNTFYDPYSIRDASISNVVTLADTGLDAVCVKFNAKNPHYYLSHTHASLWYGESLG